MAQKQPKNVIALIAQALKNKAASDKRKAAKAKKPRRPWGLPPDGMR